jgi:hypothetical protein
MSREDPYEVAGKLIARIIKWCLAREPRGEEVGECIVGYLSGIDEDRYYYVLEELGIGEREEFWSPWVRNAFLELASTIRDIDEYYEKLYKKREVTRWL